AGAPVQAPQVRDQYVVPFTNMNSLKADQQDCAMKLAVQQVKDEETSEKAQESEKSLNIYKSLTQELSRMNDNLYVLQTSDTQKYIALRANLLGQLEQYNKKGGQTSFAFERELPKVLNSVQTEIEDLLPGLSLSKKYHAFAKQ
ncbi:MAG: hypothetical protein AAF203_08715, partial [Pseudomonadota bacterium]